MRNKWLGLLNILVIIVNGVLFILPKQPVHNMPENAAGILIMIMLTVVALFFVHIILLGVALYWRKKGLLRALSVIYFPVSVALWLYVFINFL